MSNMNAMETTSPLEQPETPALPIKLEVTVRPIEPRGKLIGFASVNFGGVIVDDFRVSDGEKGMFVANSSKADSSSQSGSRSTAGIVDPGLQTQLNVAVRDAYIKEVEKLQATPLPCVPHPKSRAYGNSLPRGPSRRQRINLNSPRPKRAKQLKARSGKWMCFL